jgi:mannosyltransferase
MEWIKNKIRLHWSLIILLIILFISFLLRIYKLNEFSLWTDEGYTANTITFGYSEIINASKADIHPPLYYLLLKIIADTLGHSVFVLKMFSVFFGVLTVYITYIFGVKIFQDSKLPFILTLMVATNPLLLFYSQEVRSYSFLTFLVSVILFALVSINEQKINLKKLNKFSILFIIASIIGLYTHALFIVILGGIILYIISSYITKKINLILLYRMFICYVIIFLAFTPWLYVLVNQVKISTEFFWLKFDPINDLTRNTTNFFTSESYFNFGAISNVSKSLLENIGLIFFVSGFVYLTKVKYIAKNLHPVLLVFSLLGFAFFFSFRSPVYYIRYLIFATIPILIVCTFGFDLIYQKYYKTFAIGTLLFFVALSGLFFTNNIQQNPDRYDYRKVVLYIQNQEKNNYIVLHPSAMSSWDSFKYHNSELGINLKSEVYSPSRSDPKYMKSVILENEYFKSNLNNFNTIFSVYAYGENELTVNLLNNNFCKIREIKITQLNVVTWKKCIS